MPKVRASGIPLLHYYCSQLYCKNWRQRVCKAKPCVHPTRIKQELRSLNRRA